MYTVKKIKSIQVLLTSNVTHSLNQSPSLFDAPGTEAFASE